MQLTAETEHLLQLFILLSGVLLIPVVVGLLLVLFKLAFLIHSVSEFLTIARYEFSPLIKEIRLTVEHVEEIGHRASSGIKGLGDSLSQAGPLVKEGLAKTKFGVASLLSGVSRSFRQF